MLYFISRLIVWIVSFCVLIKKRNGKRSYRRSFFYSFLIFLLILVLPIENIFFSFSSPSDAYRYRSTQNVLATIDGAKTTLVIGGTSDSIEYAIFPKKQDKWKLDVLFSIHSKKSAIFSSAFIDVIQYQHSSEYYVTITTPNNELPTDNYNSNFIRVGLEDDSSAYYVAYVPEFDEDYQIILGDQVYSLS